MQLKATYSQIWQLAYPLMLGSLAQNLSNVINTAFMGRVSEVSLGAAAIGGVMYFSFTLIALGLGTGAQIMIARKAGEKKNHEIGTIFDHSIYLFAALGVILYFFFFFAAPAALQYLLKSEAVYVQSTEFLYYRTVGVAFSIGNTAFRGFYTGIGRTKVISGGIWIMAIVNVVLDYSMIFGNFGLPAMGIRGAGLASSLAELACLIFYIWVALKSKYCESLNIFRFKDFSWALMGKITNLSMPMVMQYFVSLSAWFLFFVAIEQLGEHALAISNVLRSLYMLIMTPIWGYSSSTTTLVSNIIGQGKRSVVDLAIRRSLYISLITAFVVTIGFMIFPEMALSLFTNDLSIVHDGIPSLYVIGASMLLFAAAVIFLSSVSGTGDTKAAFVIEASAIAFYAVYLVCTVFLFPQSLTVVWMAEFVYWIILGGFSYLRLRSGRWKTIQI